MSSVRNDVGQKDPADQPRHEGEAAEATEGQHVLEPWSDREEVHALPDILRPTEALVAVGSGTVVRTGRLAQTRWLVVVTDRRLLCLKGREPATRKVIDMPISAIRSVDAGGVWRKTLVLDTGFGTLRISGVRKAVAEELVTGLTALTDAFEEAGETGYRATSSPPPDPPDAAMGAATAAGTPDAGATQAGAGPLAELSETVRALSEELKELRVEVALLEGLVRANVETGPGSGPTEVGE